MSWKKSIKNSLTCVFAFSLLMSSGIINTSAESVALDAEFLSTGNISIYPCEFNPEIPQSKSWFIEKAKPGETLERCAEIANTTGEEKTIDLSAEDEVPSSGGAFGLSTGTEKKGVGSWITLPKQKVTISSNKGERVRFQIKVPENLEAGEYAGGITIMEDESSKVKSGFSIKNRFGVRLYVTVPPEDKLSMGTEFSKFEIITPASEEKAYQDYIKKTKAYPADKMIMTWNFKNTSNIYSKLKGKIEITTPDGQTSQEYSADYSPNYEVYIPYVDLQGKWTTAGKYKVRFTFASEAALPWNKPQDIKKTSSKDFVETEIDMTQEMIDKIKADKVVTDSTKAVSSSSAPAQQEGEGDIKPLKEEEVAIPQTGGKEKNNNMLLYAMGGGIMLLLLALIIVVFMKKKKEDKKEEVTEVKS